MKKDIHPAYHEITVTCACGNSFKTRSAIKGNSLKLDICNKCHPFFTGQRKLVDASGRIDKFKKKYNI